MAEYLTISHLQKQFGDVQVLKDISLTVNQGEVVSIIGPSGSVTYIIIPSFRFRKIDIAAVCNLFGNAEQRRNRLYG